MKLRDREQFIRPEPFPMLGFRQTTRIIYRKAASKKALAKSCEAAEEAFSNVLCVSVLEGFALIPLSLCDGAIARQQIEKNLRDATASEVLFGPPKGAHSTYIRKSSPEVRKIERQDDLMGK
jgi:hypothetical protein